MDNLANSETSTQTQTQTSTQTQTQTSTQTQTQTTIIGFLALFYISLQPPLKKGYF